MSDVHPPSKPLSGTNPKSRIEELIFLGTGTSGMIPTIHCLTDPKSTCQVCKSSLGPLSPFTSATSTTKATLKSSSNTTPGQTLQWSKNRRRNTSMVVRYRHSSGTLKTILIDTGTVAFLWFFVFFILVEGENPSLIESHSLYGVQKDSLNNRAKASIHIS